MPRVHLRKTYTDGANQMLVSNSWHGSRPLDKLSPGDTLKVKNLDTGELTEWRITTPAEALSPQEAEAEWNRYPFGNRAWAKKYGFFPFMVRNLERIASHPPEKLPARYIPSEVKIDVWHRDEGKCKSCGRAEELEFDHIIPVSKGGSNTVNNVEILCKSCNRKKSNKIM